MSTLKSGSSRASPVLLWAALGALFSCFSISVFSAWLLSADAFVAVPITAADSMPGHTLALLRGLEWLSVAVAVLGFYAYLIKPWLRTGEAPLAGLLLVGALITYVLDTTVNFSDYHMAWNKHSFNHGTWASFFPGHTGPTQYAEAWLWGPPMYMYFGVALASIQLYTYRLTRPRAGRVLALLLAFAAAFIFDLIAESAIIRFTEAYAWPYTLGSLTVWVGTQFQFPLYESLLVAIYASLYSWLMHSSRGGVSFIERGINDVSARYRLLVRLCAATGFAAVCTAIYFGGFYAFSQFADTRVEMPSYLMYSDEDWQPSVD
ncbi:MAG: spirocyclase AveC family protein [Pseudomonas sp.]